MDVKYFALSKIVNIKLIIRLVVIKIRKQTDHVVQNKLPTLRPVSEWVLTRRRSMFRHLGQIAPTLGYNVEDG